MGTATRGAFKVAHLHQSDTPRDLGRTPQRIADEVVLVYLKRENLEVRVGDAVDQYLGGAEVGGLGISGEV